MCFPERLRDPSRCYKPYLLLSASTPGSFLPSRNSSDAPPVEMWQRPCIALSAFQVLQPICKGFHFGVQRT